MLPSDGVVPTAEPVVINYSSLVTTNASLYSDIVKAFGSDGLGLLVVEGVPGFAQARKRLLPFAQALAALPSEVLSQLEDPLSHYNFGWSHGRESLASGQLDTHKGSFYANPVVDAASHDSELQEKYPSYCRPNIWPREALPDLESAFKECGGIIVRVGLHLARRCDELLSKLVPQGTAVSLADSLANSPCHKARLLHYFASDEETLDGALVPEAEDSWCGWHYDHGSLTGLCAALYLDPEGREVGQRAVPLGLGLRVRDRAGDTVRVTIPRDAIAFQIGETAQVYSGGRLRATAHCVAGGGAPSGMTRETFAVFMQPRWDERMDCPRDEEQAASVGQWKFGMTFGEFAEATFAKYYGPSK